MKRWLATLCVALLSFAWAEQAFAADACHSAAESAPYNITLAASALAVPEEQPAVPLQERTHHCCAAHVAPMPATPLQTPAATATGSAVSMLRNETATYRAIDGPERPPRPVATV